MTQNDQLTIISELKKWRKKSNKQKQIEKKKKKSRIFFFLHFSKLPQKRCQGGRSLHPQPPQSVFEEVKAEEAAESS